MVSRRVVPKFTIHYGSYSSENLAKGVGFGRVTVELRGELNLEGSCQSEWGATVRVFVWNG